MTREQAIKIARKIPVDGTLKEAVDAVLAIDRAAREECADLNLSSERPDDFSIWEAEDVWCFTITSYRNKIRETMEEK
jgi:hypothetical protein